MSRFVAAARLLAQSMGRPSLVLPQICKSIAIRRSIREAVRRRSASGGSARPVPSADSS